MKALLQPAEPTDANAPKMRPGGVQYQKPPDLYKPHRKPRLDYLYVPLGYGIVIPMMRFFLQKRLTTEQLYKVYIGTVCLALCHAGYVTAKDSTV